MPCPVTLRPLTSFNQKRTAGRDWSLTSHHRFPKDMCTRLMDKFAACALQCDSALSVHKPASVLPNYCSRRLRQDDTSTCSRTGPTCCVGTAGATRPAGRVSARRLSSRRRGYSRERGRGRRACIGPLSLWSAIHRGRLASPLQRLSTASGRCAAGCRWRSRAFLMRRGRSLYAPRGHRRPRTSCGASTNSATEAADGAGAAAHRRRGAGGGSRGRRGRVRSSRGVSHTSNGVKGSQFCNPHPQFQSVALVDTQFPEPRRIKSCQLIRGVQASVPEEILVAALAQADVFEKCLDAGPLARRPLFA
mmetsp:Transcript_111812/g.361007  ORF Transcript_111812/g.361007 Transcript_111812/m.361007 type:complete len:305 (+) Transcript_111812:1-915(+)